MSIRLCAGMAAMGCSVVVAAGQSGFPYCQVIDGSDAPAWSAQVSYTAPADVQTDAGRSIAFWAVRGGGGLYYRDTKSGAVSLGGSYEVLISDGNGGVAIPDILAALRLEAGWTLRWWDGRALQLLWRPGLYSDTEDWSSKDFFSPFEVNGVQAINSQLSCVLGLALYPGFERTFDPRFGFRYAPADSMRIDLMYPETRLTYRPADWEIALGVRHDAVREYRLEKEDPRRLMAIRETRVYLAGAWPIGDLLRMTAEVGQALNREIDFDRVETVLDIDDTWYVQFGVGGML